MGMPMSTALKQSDTMNKNTNTYTILSEADAVLTGLVNMETGIRGFAITGGHGVLWTPYKRRKNRIRRSFYVNQGTDPR